MRLSGLLGLMCAIAGAVIIDRIAVVAGGTPIKDSDITREIRVVSFLNNAPADTSAKGRRDAAQRLIDQTILRGDIEAGRYAVAESAEVATMLAKVRARHGAGYAKALQQHQVTEDEVRVALTWQLTVLHYIERRFHGGAGPTADDITAYYNEHRTALGSSSLEQSRAKIETILRGEAVNKEFFDWLERSRKDLNIRYLEDDLR
jgi:hypothetical protein